MTAPADPESKFARNAWIRALQRSASIDEHPERTLPLLIDGMAREFGPAPALESRAGSLTYTALAARSHQYARWARSRGLTSGDVAALLMPNCAEYVAVWLGLTRIGVTVALLNTHLAREALAHCIEIASPRLLIAGAEFAPMLVSLRPRLKPDLERWVLGADAPGAGALSADAQDPALDPALRSISREPLAPDEYAAPTLDATALYIYTSGTTGLPKAAKVTHYRLMRWSLWFAGLMDTGPRDRMYNCLPLYHSVGGVVAVGAVLAGGGAVVIRPRFSVSDFWRDVRDERCTLFQYIGELCRYLVNAPHQPAETEHALRLACGNGLRPEVWEPFKSRFRIPRILEYYASTEGNFSLYNCEGQPGAIGRIPSFLAHRLPVALLRFDYDGEEPIRNAEGFCERCAADEAGEAVGLIADDERARAGRFEGYADAQATERKVLRNVFKPGDAWYRTGDLMRRDAAGFYYFVDRIGDTFRWKGENVSTAEVMSALAAAPGVTEGVVYGVSVPGTDGRAGMAALVVDATFDLGTLRAHAVERLPSYARPVFLRLLVSLEATGTFKPRKQDLLRQGFDPAGIADRLYFDDARCGAYVPLDAVLHAEISKGRIRL
jgi:fatty-acyl-CoA synthase